MNACHWQSASANVMWQHQSLQLPKAKLSKELQQLTLLIVHSLSLIVNLPSVLSIYIVVLLLPGVSTHAAQSCLNIIAIVYRL